MLGTAVSKRLRADVPVVSYLSGGVDSSLVVAMANKVMGLRAVGVTTVLQAARAAGRALQTRDS